MLFLLHISCCSTDTNKHSTCLIGQLSWKVPVCVMCIRGIQSSVICQVFWTLMPINWISKKFSVCVTVCSIEFSVWWHQKCLPCVCVVLKVWCESWRKERQGWHGLRPGTEERTRFHREEVCITCRPVFTGQTDQASACSRWPPSLTSVILLLFLYDLPVRGPLGCALQSVHMSVCPACTCCAI